MSRLVIALMATILFATAAQAQAPSAVDVEIVKQLAQDNLDNIDLSRLADTNSSSSIIKKFAANLVEARSDNNAKLAIIAKTAQIPIPADTGATYRTARAQLANLKGLEFDHAYVIAARQRQQALLDFASNANAQNAALKDFIADTKAAAEKQLKMAQDLPDN